ncbi:MAG: DHHA1 domain-containing protein, partial [Tissierellales bacterium]
PDATAVINPNRMDNQYPFTKLAGVGVALKLIQALASKLNVSIDYEDILPIVAIGTVADVVSLTGENRVIVKNGLEMIKQSDNPGIKAILEVTGLINREVTSGHIGFVIGPRINAAGRIGMAKHAVELFVTNNFEEAQDLAKMLNEENIKRQNIETEILKEAEEIINKEVDLEKAKVIVIASENWHNGVIGIVSSRITEKYNRPSILISIEGKEGRGSARSISTFNIYENLNKCKELLIKFGGHSQAAGLTIEESKIKEFKNKISSIAADILDDIDLTPEIKVDSEIDAVDISLELAYELKLLEPLGIGNPSSNFLYKGSLIKTIRTVGKDGKHLKLTVEKDGQSIECIGFNFGRYIKVLDIGQQIDLVVSLDINDYLGQKSIQFLIKDIIISYKKILYKSEDYIESLLNIVVEPVKDVDIKLENLPVEYFNDVERINYTINSILKRKNILIIINNIFNLYTLLDAMRYEGRDFIKKIGISYNTIVGNKSCEIIINPIICNLNIRKYEKVIVYDMCLTHSNLIETIDVFKNNDLQILTVKNDFNRNTYLIDQIMPRVEDIRLIYKTMIMRREEYLRIETEEYLDALENRTGIRINRFKLIIILTILKDAELLEYDKNNNFISIRVLEKPEKKIDITSVSIYAKLYKLSKEIEKLKNKFNLLY